MELAQRSCPVPLLLLLLGLSTGRFGQKVHQRLVPPLSRDENLLVDLCFLKHIPFPLFLLCIIILLLNFTLFFFFLSFKVLFLLYFLALGGLCFLFSPAPM